MARETTALEITGLDQLEAGFAALEAYAEKDVIVNGLKKGAEIVRQEAQTLAPEKTGKLKSAIRVRVGRKGKGSFSVLAAVGRRWFAGNEFYGAFQEFGWKTGKRRSENRKPVPGEHFMQHAFDEKASQAMESILAEFRAGIDRELEKARTLRSS